MVDSGYNLADDVIEDDNVLSEDRKTPFLE